MRIKTAQNICIFLLLLLQMLMPERSQGQNLVTHDNYNGTDSILAKNTFIRFVDEGDEISISEEEFFDQAGRVVFPVNDYRLPRNAPLLKQL